MLIPSENETWQLHIPKMVMEVDSWEMFHCHIWLPELDGTSVRMAGLNIKATLW